MTLKKKKKKIQKGKVVSDKTLFFAICPFRTPHSICLNIAFHRAIWYENVAFSTAVVLTEENRTRVF